MTIQAFDGSFPFPSPLGWGSAGSFSGQQINASAEKVAFIFTIPKTGTLDKFEFLLGTVTQAPASGIRCSFQNLDASGDPDGTQDEYRDVTSGITSDTWLVPGLITDNGGDGGNKRSVTVGDRIAAVVEFVSWGAGDDLEVDALNITSLATVENHNYVDLYTASWAKVANVCPNIALKYDDGSYEWLATDILPASALGSLSVNTGTTPDEVGLIFQLPFSCRVKGAWVRLAANASGRDFDVVLYGPTTRTVSVDADQLQNTAARSISVIFPAAETLLANTNYRLALKPTTANSIGAYYLDVAVAAIMDAIEGGQEFHWTQRSDAGSWSETTTRRPIMGLLIDGIDTGGAASSQLVGGGLIS
ncbi:MAG: hypothetical protein ACYST6_12100 [Planctomycetota bacterium]